MVRGKRQDRPKSPLTQWARRRRVTYRELAARCTAQGCVTSEATIKKIAQGVRSTVWERAVAISAATDHEVSPQQIIGYRSWLKGHDAHAA